jgi:hypothetical protein
MNAGGISFRAVRFQNRSRMIARPTSENSVRTRMKIS